MNVSKVNVTTPSTADASQKRRKQPANFTCPVPGCGSTFTRHFNLKGHLRSHAEEKPYQCKWPGCGKGFARQHDCKRHEQLHLNIRPYPCEGCKKNFARMDALNRHCACFRLHTSFPFTNFALISLINLTLFTQPISFSSFSPLSEIGRRRRMSKVTRRSRWSISRPGE
ncbi:hypothetical protein K474DRAFT_1588668 [Panus rudis PR-1116 ss-1]|nr:hypothetical protein K474DRAFT_1588668 [Panus rudis PR-1116 ss-1]